ncbi:hypothetical protein ACP70R_036014 [Stipagrostis hirtigluma subsp. patula]
MAGSSRPDAAGRFREGPQPSAAGTPRAVAEPRSPAQYLSLEPLPVGDSKQSRTAELRRVLGVAVEAEQPFGLVQTKPLPSIASEELKRIRGGVVEASARARDRADSLQECIQKLDKYRNVVTRKRQRSEGSSGRSLGGGPGALRMVAPQHGAENPGQRFEERAKSATASKRARSSLAADVRLEGCSNAPRRQSTSVDNEKNFPLEKEKSFIRTASATTGVSEDKLRSLPPGGEGWEKKLKRKRSVGTMLNRGNDVDRDVRPLVHRSNNEVCTRSTDGLSFRHGASTGASGGSKMDGNSKQGNAGSRYMAKMDMDATSLPNERREHHAELDKGRTSARGNKTHTPEDLQPGMSLVTKSKACRAPRTSSLVMNSSYTFQGSVGGSDEWEEAPCTNKASPSGGTMNREHPISASRSSPPVAWVGQRSQKMSRTRRANVVSPVSNFDEALSEGSPRDVAVRPAVESSGLSYSRGVSSNNKEAVPRIVNSSSPVGLSESEGSAVTENKNKEKVDKNEAFEDEAAKSAHTGKNLLFSRKKSSILLKEELGDGSIRRQGRSGRSTMHVKGCTPMSKEKLDNADTRKLLKSRIPVSEKNESKLGHPPMKKGSDHKASFRHLEILNCGSIDIAAESEDDQEELLAAANAARNAIVGAYAGPFWKKIEPMLTFISPEDLSVLKNQITLLEELEIGMPKMPDESKTIPNKYSGQPSMGGNSSHVLPPSHSSVLLEQTETNGIGPRVDILSCNDENHRVASQKTQAQGWFGEMAPLTHRLLSALILEDDNEFSECGVAQGDIILEFSHGYLPYASNRCFENEFDPSAVESSFGLSPDFKYPHNNSVHKSISNGFTASSNLRSSCSQNSMCRENISDGINFMLYPENGSFHEFTPYISQQCQIPGEKLSLPSNGHEYGQMSLHDRILIELQSIEIFPEMPELDGGQDEDINKLILELQKRLFEQVNQKKCHLHKLEKAIRDTKNMEERSLEQHAMNKLVEMAYKKLMVGRGSSSHKAGFSKVSSKAEKQLALVFAKRTLARCQKFEETGKSCFREPFLWSVLSAPLPKNDARDGDPPGFADRPKPLKLDRTPLSQGSLSSKVKSISSDPAPGSTKWKKNDRERDHNRDASSKSSNSKSGRNSSGSGRGDRKPKIKTKQKLAQLSTSGNVLGGVTESSLTPRESHELPDTSGVKPAHPVRNGTASIAQESPEPPLANLHAIDPMDILDVPEGNDISSWFTDGLDDSLQDFDLSGGLEIPDDDLSLLGFM